MNSLNPVTVAVTVGAVIVVSKWIKGDAPNTDNAIGVAGIALSLAVLEQINEQLAAAFSLLILVTVAAIHLPEIVKAIGFAK